MGEELSKDDLLELQRRRMADQVQEAVEKSLIKRYTWLGIVISISIIAGVITSIISLNSDAAKKIAETQYLLDKSKKSMEEVENITNSVKDKFQKLDKDLASAFAGKESNTDKLGQLTSQIGMLDKKVNDLVIQLNKSLEKQNLPRVSQEGDNKIQIQMNKLQDQIARSKLTIYLQYYNVEDQGQIEKVRDFLKTEGYVVPKLELIKHHKEQYREIRYFHDDEEDEAQRLKTDLEGFLAINHSDIKLKVRNASKSFSNVQKGIIELWMYFGRPG